MSRIRESPWTLRLAAIGFLVAVFVPIPSDAPAGPYVGAFVLISVLVVFLLAGSRIAWVLAIVLIGAGVVGTALNGTWWEVTIRLLLLILLLMPAPRAFVGQRSQPK